MDVLLPFGAGSFVAEVVIESAELSGGSCPWSVLRSWSYQNQPPTNLPPDS